MSGPGAPAAPRRRGRTRWCRFALACAPPLVATAVAGTTTLAGLAPLALAEGAHRPLKFSARSVTATSSVPTLAPFRTRRGHRQTELVVRTRGLTVRDLCLSRAEHTPAGTYVLRITSPTLTSRALDVALDGVRRVDLLGLPVHTRVPIPLDATPVAGGDPGIFDLEVGGRAASTTVGLRWITAEPLRLGHLTVRAGRDQPECF